MEAIEYRSALIEAYAARIVDGMDFKDLWAFAIENMEANLSTYSDEQLLAEIGEFAPDLIGE